MGTIRKGILVLDPRTKILLLQMCIRDRMKDAEGVTEELKRTQQMEWVRRCNNIHNRAEEIILQEMIYS